MLNPVVTNIQNIYKQMVYQHHARPDGTLLPTSGCFNMGQYTFCYFNGVPLCIGIKQ